MGRSPKTPKFEAFNAYANSFGQRQRTDRSWQDYLGTDKPVVLEIGCARADFLMTLARENSDINYIGIDRRSDRLYFPARDALEERLNNIAFIQMDTREILDYFDPGSIDEIWLTFPDPYPRDKHEKNRMSGGKFLQLYHELLKKGGMYNFKTDNQDLFTWSLEQIQKTPKIFELEFTTTNLHKEIGHESAKIITVYEKRFLAEGLNTKYLRAKKL